MSTPTHTDERRTPASRLALKPGVYFHGLRYDLLEGREWHVTSERSGMTYVVVFYQHNGQRFGYCECKAASFNVPCRHLVFAAKSDSILTKAPMRDVSELRRAA